MIDEVELSVCDTCNLYALVGKKCPECKGEMQVIVFVRKASQLTPVAGDGASCSCNFPGFDASYPSKCPTCGKPHRR